MACADVDPRPLALTAAAHVTGRARGRARRLLGAGLQPARRLLFTPRPEEVTHMPLSRCARSRRRTCIVLPCLPTAISASSRRTCRPANSRSCAPCPAPSPAVHGFSIATRGSRSTGGGARSPSSSRRSTTARRTSMPTATAGFRGPVWVRPDGRADPLRRPHTLEPRLRARDVARHRHGHRAVRCAVPHDRDRQGPRGERALRRCGRPQAERPRSPTKRAS